MAKQLVILLLLWPALALALPGALRNQLAQHPSPYLAQHGSDPVAWQEWNAETLARAKREKKLLFVSVGYFACHWCHVMQRESYKNPQIAARLNRDFIPVKVDRELNTGLDDALQVFSEKLLRIAGWPLNAFVTPEGYPVYVVLYAPPDEFRGVLEKLSDRWRADRTGIEQLARKAHVDPPAPRAQRMDRQAIQQWENAFLKQVRTEWDELRGGFGQVSKFPMNPQLILLLELASNARDAELTAFLRLTLDQMRAKGLRDHVGGGFFRYTIDPGWETPHFEKMLYDNAQLALLYLRAAEVFDAPAYRETAFTTLDFMLETLQDPDGGLQTSVSAVDRTGREGAAYLWHKTSLQKILTAAEFNAARRVWRLDAPPPFEFGHLPAEWVEPAAAERSRLDSAMKKMKKVRAVMIQPKDDKRNAGLNGIALSALSAAMRQNPEYAKAASSLAHFIATRLSGKDGLVKSAVKGRRIGGAELEDYAYVVTGLLDYADAAGSTPARILAVRLAHQAWQLFYTEKGWRREAEPLLKTALPEAILPDGAVPSPSAMLVAASLRADDAALAFKARQALAWLSPAMARDPFAYATQIRAYRQAN